MAEPVKISIEESIIKRAVDALNNAHENAETLRLDNQNNTNQSTRCQRTIDQLYQDDIDEINRLLPLLEGTYIPF